MADYFPVLSRAVAGLENNTGEARRAVYDRARAAIVRQLRAIEPPLAEEDINRERMQLEEAIRKVEAGAGATAAPEPAVPARPVPPPSQSAPPSPSSRPSPSAPPKPAAAPSTPQSRPPVSREPSAAPRREAAPQAPAGGKPQARPATRPDGRPIIAPVEGGAAQGKPKRSGAVVAIAALGVIAVGVGLFLSRGHISALLGGGSSTQTAQTPAAQSGAPAAEKPAEQAARTEEPAEKSDDRLPQDQAANDRAPTAEPAPQEPSAPPSAPPAEQEVARAPDAAAPAAPAQPAEPPAQQQPASPPAGPLVAQRAVLYEEGPNQQSGEALQGSVVWRLESVSGGQGQPLETALRGDIDVPARKLRATLTIRRNGDATLPASHTIEIQFTLPDDFPNAGISNVPGMLMKADESARGAAVSGLSVRVTNGFFLIGLSNLETERSVNEQLLRDRGWIDVPILYDNGRRAVLTLEKGTPGAQAFQDAFSAWRSASASNPAAGVTR